MNRKKDIKQDEIIFITVRNPVTGIKTTLKAYSDDIAKKMIDRAIGDGMRVVMDNADVKRLVEELKNEKSMC